MFVGVVGLYGVELQLGSSMQPIACSCLAESFDGFGTDSCFVLALALQLYNHVREIWVVDAFTTVIGSDGVTWIVLLLCLILTASHTAEHRVRSLMSWLW